MSKQMNTMIEVPFNSIDIPDDQNARTDLKDIDKLAASIKADGLLQPLLVINGGPEDKPYTLKAGFRRAHALKLLKWGSNLVQVTVTTPEGATVKNLVENLQRQDLPSIDLAQRLHDLETGEYPTAPGETPTKYTKKELSERLGKSLSHVSNLIRAHKNLIAEAKKVWRKHDVPTTTIFAWAGLSEEEQEGAVKKWLKEQERIKERAAAKAEGGESESKSRSKDEEGEDGPQPLVKGKKAAELETKKDILQWKIDTGVIKAKEDVAEAQGQILLIRYMLGELARFPSVSKAEEKEYNKWLAAQEPQVDEDESEDESEDE